MTAPSSGHARFAASPVVARLRESSFERANREWLAMHKSFRRFVAKQAGLPPEKGEDSLFDLAEADLKAMMQANGRLVELSVAARGPLISAVCERPVVSRRKAA